jgi:hypothetical protein
LRCKVSPNTFRKEVPGDTLIPHERGMMTTFGPGSPSTSFVKDAEEREHSGRDRPRGSAVKISPIPYRVPWIAADESVPTSPIWVPSDMDSPPRIPCGLVSVLARSVVTTSGSQAAAIVSESAVIARICRRTRLAGGRARVRPGGLTRRGPGRPLPLETHLAGSSLEADRGTNMAAPPQLPPARCSMSRSTTAGGGPIGYTPAAPACDGQRHLLAGDWPPFG